MSFSSSIAGVSLDTPDLSSNSSLPVQDCYTSAKSILIFTTFSVTNMLLVLPLCVLVLQLGFQRRRKRRSGSSAAATTSHSDVFTFHLVALEMIAILGSIFFFAGEYAGLPVMATYSLEIFFSPWCVKIHFHTLTCVERYLAVVHPVTYLGLKNRGGVRIRNVSIGLLWLVGIATSFVAMNDDFVPYLSSVALALIIVSFCSLSVLRALRRPGPGETGQDGERVDKMKRRAFRTIVTITGVLFFGLGGMLVCDAVDFYLLMNRSAGCIFMMSTVWFSLPSSLVLPLLFLHRAGKLPGCKH